MAVYGSLSATQKAVVDAAGDVSSVSANLENIASLLEDNYAQFDTQIQSLPVLLQNMITDQMDTLVTAINTLTDQYKELDAGSGNYTQGVDQVQKAYSQFYSAYSQVVKATDSLTSGTKNLKTGAESLENGASSFTQEHRV